MTFTERFVLAAMSAGGRLHRAWRALSSERRLAAYAAGGLFIALFLPWYDESIVVKVGRRAVQSQSVSLSGWGVFGFLELVVLLVAVGVLVLLFERAEGNRIHLPGGDGGAILAIAALTCVLIIWGMFDKPGAGGQGQYATATGLDWGIFIVLAVAALLAYAGSRIRLAPLTAAPVTAAPPASGPSPSAGAKPSPRGPSPKSPPASDATKVSRRVRTPPPVTAAGGAGPEFKAEDRRRPGESPPPPDDATRISARRGASYDRPTPASNPKPEDPDATKTSSREPEGEDETSESPTRPFGPPVIPEDPPTLKISRRRPPHPRDDA